MQYTHKLPWPKGRLKALGRALQSDETPPTDCPTYTEVLMWHHDLSVAVQEEIELHEWVSVADRELLTSSRAKTLDTLVQKLDRERMTLDQVQDLAGVRVDGQFTLSEQTEFASELARHFGVTEPNHIRDLRKLPHSGYRAVHVWLRLPAGRVEVQIRTELQSAWANFYERLGDTFGRAIRYGGQPLDHGLPDEAGQMLQEIVETMHEVSESNFQTELNGDTLHRLLDDPAVDRAGVQAALERYGRMHEESVDRLGRLSAKLDGPT